MPPTHTATERLIPDCAVDLVVDAFNHDRVDDEIADAIRDALNHWYTRHRPPAPTRRTGVINRWHAHENFGFATEDGTRRPWFLTADDLPPGLVRLDKGTRVAFHGAPEPGAGRKYPHALGVEALAPRCAGGQAVTSSPP